MDALVDIINQLQEVFAASGQKIINLPQIVVVGTQSSGKSSVLEQIVGKSFLPRGTGIVTRCPLILQLVQTKDQGDKEYAVFQHNKSKQFTDDDSIRKEISEETERLAGTNLNICSQPIILKLYSPKLINLTLVDLPGLTKVPVGDQPRDIESQIRCLVQEYIDNPDAIIVAVTAANVDIANSESLKIAKEVDPEGRRTLAVITKLDLMDKGTDAWDVLGGKVIPVKLGIVGVVNRSQQDIMDNKPISESLQDEEKFFKTHYKAIADYQGSLFLANRVQELLVGHIKKIMPQLKVKIQDKLSMHNTELGIMNINKQDKGDLLLELITNFCELFKDIIKGNLREVQTNKCKKKLFGGAKVLKVMREDFSVALLSVEPLEGVSKESIITDMKNASGIDSSIFVPEVAFELMVLKQIERLRGPSLNCLDQVIHELNIIIENVIMNKNLALFRYPKLQKEFSIFVPEILEQQLPSTKAMINNFLDVQLCSINKNHPDFAPNSEKWLEKLDKDLKDHSQESEEEDSDYGSKLKSKDKCEDDNITLSSEQKKERDCKMIRLLIKSYFSIIKKTIHDTVPKIIMHFLINHLIKSLHNKLVQKLYKDELLQEYLEESKEMVIKRTKLEKEVKALKEAIAITNNFLPTIEDILLPDVSLEGKA